MCVCRWSLLCLLIPTYSQSCMHACHVFFCLPCLCSSIFSLLPITNVPSPCVAGVGRRRKRAKEGGKEVVRHLQTFSGWQLVCLPSQFPQAAVYAFCSAGCALCSMPGCGCVQPYSFPSCARVSHLISPIWVPGRVVRQSFFSAWVKVGGACGGGEGLRRFLRGNRQWADFDGGPFTGGERGECGEQLRLCEQTRRKRKERKNV